MSANKLDNFTKHRSLSKMLMILTIGVFSYFASDYTYSGKDVYIWFNSSTVKFVNNWLIENPAKINFIMYENYPSIEFNSIEEREAYISFPPGAVIPPYICAKILNKSKIDINFLSYYNKFNCVLCSILVCCLFYGFLTRKMKIRRQNLAIAISLILSVAWICLPVNLMYLRNHYFSEQASVPLILLFLISEIYRGFSKDKSLLLRYLYNIFLFLLIFLGTITDYCFMSVVFVAWLVRVYSETRKSENKLRTAINASLRYVVPVMAGITFFLWQIGSVPNHWEILKNRIEVRSYGKYSFEGYIGDASLISMAIAKMRTAYGTLGCLFFICSLILIATYFRNHYSREKIKDERVDNLLYFSIIIYLSPLLNILVFFNYTAVHYHAFIKITLPYIFAVFSLSFIISETRHRKKIMNMPLLLLLVLLFSSTVLYVNIKRSFDWYHFRLKTKNITEIALLVRENHSFNDVFVSFTDSIGANPPAQYVIAEKRIYLIENENDIRKKFPKLNKDARLMFVIDNDDSFKSPEIIEAERRVVERAEIRCSSKHFDIFELKKSSFNCPSK